MKDRSEYMRNYRNAHKATLTAKKKAYYILRKKDVLATVRCYAKLHKMDILSKKKRYYAQHKKEIAEKRKTYISHNREKVAQGLQRYYRSHKEYIIARVRKRYRTDVSYRINQNMSTSIRKSLKGKKKNKHWEDIVGYTKEQLITDIESKFTPEMSWENYGTYWHIDHQKPKSLFNITTYDCQELRDCWALSNLHPLEAKENIRKSNKYPYIKESYDRENRC